jgi:hypothetical protein
MKFAGCALSILILIAGCTSAPRVVQPAGPSLDGGVANSGIIQVLPGRCYLVTPLFAERYAGLVKVYGTKLNPPMTAPRWIAATGTNTFIITSDGMGAFAELSFYNRQHQVP